MYRQKKKKKLFTIFVYFYRFSVIESGMRQRAVSDSVHGTHRNANAGQFSRNRRRGVGQRTTPQPDGHV